MPRYNDEFTDLDISRQRRYQLRKMKAGLCGICGVKPISNSDRCKSCYRKVRETIKRRRKA